MDELVSCERGNYFIQEQTKVADTYYFIAFNRKKKAEKPYMVGEKQADAVMRKYSNLSITDSYIAALEEWNRRIASAISNLKTTSVNAGR